MRAMCVSTVSRWLPPMCNEKLHGLLHPGSERVLTSEQQQQLGGGQLQQHACDFTGKRLKEKMRTHLVSTL